MWTRSSPFFILDQEKQHPKGEISAITVHVPGKTYNVGLSRWLVVFSFFFFFSFLPLFLFLQVRQGESLILIINHDSHLKASPHLEKYCKLLFVSHTFIFISFLCIVCSRHSVCIVCIYLWLPSERMAFKEKKEVNVTSHWLPPCGRSSGLYIGMIDWFCRIGFWVIEMIFKKRS